MFTLMAVALPFVGLAVVEGGLRLAGFGGYPAFLRSAGKLPTGGEVCLVEPAASKPYFFANPDRPGYADQTNFLMPKPAGLLRVFIFGESAAKGYPQPPNLSMTSFLRMMLEDALPGKDVEIINMGTTAVSSFPIVYMVREALRYDPDLFIFYTGNNEFFGAYGVASINAASTLPPWALRVMRWLRGSAIIQALDGWLNSGRGGDRTLMEQMMGSAAVAPDSPLRQAAARNLRENLGLMLEASARAGIPTMVCTTASNLSGLAPLGEEAAGAGDASAGKAFERAGEFVKAGDPDAAREAFRLARDLDTLPWRPTSEIEDSIREAARESGAVLCDIAKVFDEIERAEGGAGWALLDDHVHLSVRGQAEAARAMVASMGGLPSPWNEAAEKAAGLSDWKSYADRAGTNIYDDYRVAHNLRVLFRIPFMKRSNPDALLRYENTCKAAEAEWPEAVREEALRWQTLAPHAGGLRPLTAMVGRVFLAGGRPQDALPLYQIARTQVPDYTSWYIEYVYFSLACREKLNGRLDAGDLEAASRAIAQGEFLLRNGDSQTGLTERYVGRLHQLRGEWEEAIPFLLAARPRMNAEDLVACDQALFLSYLKTGRKAEAMELAERGIRESGRFAPVYSRMKAGVDQKP